MDRLTVLVMYSPSNNLNLIKCGWEYVQMVKIVLPFYQGTWAFMEFCSLCVLGPKTNPWWYWGCLCLRPPLGALMAPWSQCLVLCVSLCFHPHLSLWVSDPAPRCSFLKDWPGPSVVSWALCPPSSAFDLPIMAMVLKLYPVKDDTSAIFHRIHGQKVLEWILGLCCKFSLYPELHLEWLECLFLWYIYILK